MKTYKTINWIDLPDGLDDDFAEALEDSMGHYKYFKWDIDSTYLHGGDHDAFAVKMDSYLRSQGAAEGGTVLILIDW